MSFVILYCWQVDDTYNSSNRTKGLLIVTQLDGFQCDS